MGLDQPAGRGDDHNPDLLTPKPLPSISLKTLTISAKREQPGRPACYPVSAPPTSTSQRMWPLTSGGLPCPLTHSPFSPYPTLCPWVPGGAQGCAEPTSSDAASHLSSRPPPQAVSAFAHIQGWGAHFFSRPQPIWGQRSCPSAGAATAPRPPSPAQTISAPRACLKHP